MLEDLITETRALTAEVAQTDLPEDQRTLDPVQVVNSTRKQQRSIGSVLQRIADAMEDLLIEAENNRLDEENGRLRQRMFGGVIQPLRVLEDESLGPLDQQLDTARVAANDPQQLVPRLEEIETNQTELLEKLRQILASMVKAEGYQEAINLLKEIERSQQGVLEMTEEQRQKRIQSIFEGDEEGDNQGSDQE